MRYTHYSVFLCYFNMCTRIKYVSTCYTYRCAALLKSLKTTGLHGVRRSKLLQANENTTLFVLFQSAADYRVQHEPNRFVRKSNDLTLSILSDYKLPNRSLKRKHRVP